MNERTTSADPRSRRPLIVLDRDGVINRDSDAFIKSPDEWIAIPGSPEAIGRLNEAGFTVIVATNQSGVGRGLISEAALDAIHDKMTAILAAEGGRLDAIYFCPHEPGANCVCRKPRPGLLQKIMREYERSASELIIVGDSLRDLEAAWAIGAPALLVLTGNGRAAERRLPPDRPVEIFADLAAVADHLTA